MEIVPAICSTLKIDNKIDANKKLKNKRILLSM